MPVVTAVETIKQANIDKLHEMLRLGNEKMLIPGLNRSEFLQKNNAKVTCYSWMSDDIVRALKSDTFDQSNYSIADYFSRWVKTMGFREDSPVEQLKLIAAILTIWPYVDDVLDDPVSRSFSREFIQEQLRKFYQERDAYLLQKKNILSLIDVETSRSYEQFRAEIESSQTETEKQAATIATIQQPRNSALFLMKRVIDELDEIPYKPLRQQTMLLTSIRLFIEGKKTATDCMEVVKNVFNYSRTKIVGGIGLEVLGLLLIAASIAGALGTFGLWCPISMIGIYFGLHCFVGLMSVVALGVGCYSVQAGFSFFKQGRSDRQCVNTLETFVTVYSHADKENQNKDNTVATNQLVAVNSLSMGDISEGSYDEEYEWEESSSFCIMQ